ncbi:unnamed protein product [Trichobilharzia regenti]|nr:unnamed protein product [Trichobilharzia regenti]
MKDFCARLASLTTEQKWLELESILHSTTCSRLNEQQMLMCMLNELPQSYQELVSRYIIALKQTINLSGYSWTESNRFSSLVKLSGKIIKYLRPPWFFYRSCQNVLPETSQKQLITCVTNLMRVYHEVHNQFSGLCNVLQTTNVEDIFQLLSHMLFTLLGFVKHSHAEVEALYNSLIISHEGEISTKLQNSSVRFQYLLKCLLSSLDSRSIESYDDEYNQYIQSLNNDGTSLNNDLCKLLTTIMENNASNELSTELSDFNSKHCKQVIKIYKYPSDRSKKSEQSIDMIINILNIYANHIYENNPNS